MRRHHFFLVLIAAVTVCALLRWRSSSGAPQASDKGGNGDERSVNSLPLSQIVLFNSGVGFFQSQGAIDGDERV